MTAILPNPRYTLGPIGTKLSAPALSGLSVGALRLPTDPLFNATLELSNVVVGSRYRVVRVSNGAQLAMGVAAASTVSLSLPVYANPMNVQIVVRKASEAPFYKPFETFATMGRLGAVAYIAQEAD